MQEIFQKLEDDNLKMINDNQVLMMNQEKLLLIEQQVRAAKEKEFDDQNATVVELECKIAASENILGLLRKRAASINIG